MTWNQKHKALSAAIEQQELVISGWRSAEDCAERALALRLEDARRVYGRSHEGAAVILGELEGLHVEWLKAFKNRHECEARLLELYGVKL